MQDSKQTLIQALEKLKPHREMAEGFLTFVESEECSEESVVQLMRYILKHVRSTEQRIINEDIYTLQNQQQAQSQTDIYEAENILEQALAHI